MHNYITNRQQFVTFNNNKSNKGIITCGVPQGSILGPLLFLLYINDMHTVCKKSFMLLFADDTNIFISGESVYDIVNTMNSELQILSSWFKLNKLSLNIRKTNMMLIKTRRKTYDPSMLDINIDGIKILEVNHVKFLGVIIDQHLTWEKHIYYVANKVSKSTGIIFKARSKLDKSTLRTLYNTFILPYLSYCITIWGHTYKKHITKLQIAQNKVLRIINFSKYRASAEPLYANLKLMKIKQLYDYFVIIFMYHYTNKLLPEHFYTLFQPNNQTHRYITRQNFGYRHNISKTLLTSFNIIIQGPIIWDKCTKQIKTSKSIYTLKRLIKNQIFVSEA